MSIKELRAKKPPYFSFIRNGRVMLRFKNYFVQYFDVFLIAHYIMTTIQIV